jgi:hypothetical protein
MEWHGEAFPEGRSMMNDRDWEIQEAAHVEVKGHESISVCSE